MNIFDLNTIKVSPYEERQKNVLYHAEEFKVRLIELPAGGSMPECEMASHVIFHVLEGRVDVRVGQEEARLTAGHCLIIEPANVSMHTQEGARIVGIQIVKKM